MTEATTAYGKVLTIRQPSPLRWLLRVIVIGYLFLLVIWPVALVARATFADGVGPVLEALSQPDVVFAFRLTLVVAFWAVVINTVFGVGVLAITILAIGLVSGVPPRGLLVRLRQRWLAIAFGFCLTVPVFMTGVDWVRWWVSISLDIGLVYLLYVSRQPEVDRPPTRRSMRAFIVIVIALALIPVGIVPAFLAPLPL